MTISPRWNSTCTRLAGFAPILSAKSDRLRAAAEPDDLALAARNLHAADRRGLHVVELLPALPLRLAGTARLAARAPERASGTAAAWAATAAAATGTRRPAGTAAGAAAAGTRRRDAGR